MISTDKATNGTATLSGGRAQNSKQICAQMQMPPPDNVAVPDSFVEQAKQKFPLAGKDVVISTPIRLLKRQCLLILVI